MQQICFQMIYCIQWCWNFCTPPLVGEHAKFHPGCGFNDLPFLFPWKIFTSYAKEPHLLSIYMLSRTVSGHLFDKLDNMVSVSTMNQCIWDGNCGGNLSAICSFLLSWIFLNTQRIPRYLLFYLFHQPCTENRGVSSSLDQTFLYLLHCCYYFE